MRVGIVGHEAAKFTPETEAVAREIIRGILQGATLMVSGRCHLGGIDVWAEEEADRLYVPKLIFPPATLTWSTGYKPRNLKIAAHSDRVHCIVVAAYPPGYRGMRFDYCYHCHARDHIKSGGCWTAKQCREREWHIVASPGDEGGGGWPSAMTRSAT